MADLVKGGIKIHKGPEIVELKVKAAETIFKTAAITIDKSGGAGDGYAQNGGDDATTQFVGMAIDDVDNSAGANGALTVRCHAGRIWPMVASGAAQATWQGRAVYLSDNQTVTLNASSTNKVLVGTVDKVESATRVLVRTVPYTPISLRSNLAEDALQSYPLINLGRQDDGVPWAVAETADTHNLSLAANVLTIDSEVANNETETSESMFIFTLPPEYVAGGTLQITGKIISQGAGTDAGSTIDFEVFKMTGEEAIGADIQATAAISMVEDAWTTFDFTVTPTTLSPGDTIIIIMTTVLVENAVNNLIATIDGLMLKMDIKG